ncbi:MAG: serine dehydrogenasease [Gammaproteobacteria bacterium]|nr:serine dehydrogenasease [Gammaproteobacteria bacterium]
MAKGANDLIERQLNDLINTVESVTSGDCLSYSGPIAFGADDAIRDAVERLRNRSKRRGSKLVIILETQGGFAEVARRISDTIRHHYSLVDFLIPSHAMSAGTILAMSGNAIYMNYYSVLGPIDPLVESQDGNKLIPAMGYLIKYEELLKKANTGKAGAAEIQILLGFDQGELYSYEQARELSVSLLEEWLVKYKFKTWKITDKRAIKVTSSMKKNRAREIAMKLNDAKRWNSHGIGINMERLRRDLNLKIDDFGDIEELNDSISSYHKLLKDYMEKMGQNAIVHTRESYEALL